MINYKEDVLKVHPSAELVHFIDPFLVDGHHVCYIVMKYPNTGKEFRISENVSKGVLYNGVKNIFNLQSEEAWKNAYYILTDKKFKYKEDHTNAQSDAYTDVRIYPGLRKWRKASKVLPEVDKGIKNRVASLTVEVMCRDTSVIGSCYYDYETAKWRSILEGEYIQNVVYWRLPFN